jgi:hypothetical protein
MIIPLRSCKCRPSGQYNAQSEALISYMSKRLAEDDVLAGGMRHPNLIRATKRSRWRTLPRPAMFIPHGPEASSGPAAQVGATSSLRARFTTSPACLL